MSKIVINGEFYNKKSTGVHRFAKELLLELDKVIQPGIIDVIVPEYTKGIPCFENIGVKKYGRLKGVLWEQFSLTMYLIKNELESLSLCNTMPLLKPGIMCIHDVAYKAHPEYFTTIHGKLSCLWHRLHFKLAVMSKKPILTVSYFSKYEIIDNYNIDPNRIVVIGNGWQHMNRIQCDYSVLKNNGLISGEYFFTLGNISKNKNTKWIYEVAKRNKEYIFVISGRKAEVSNEKYDELENVLSLGYVSDEQIKALYENCKAFIFPSIHEGFGIPPMEALSQGAKIIISNTTSLPEIYKSAAYYIDPYNFNINFKELLSKNTIDPDNILNNYSWERSAKELRKLFI